MVLAAQTASETLQVKHHYAFTPGQVFAAWSNKDALGQWFGPQSHRCDVEHYDFRQGGKYRIRMIPISEDSDCGGDSSVDSVCVGEFVKINPAKKLVMTFTWVENGGDIGDTLITIDFIPRDSGTEVILTHERLPDEAMRLAHQSGWQGTLVCLETYLQQKSA